MRTSSQLTIQWVKGLPRAKRRFPRLRWSLAPDPMHDIDGFVAYLARTHHLTLGETREEMDDFLFTESLRAELETDQSEAPASQPDQQ